MLNRLEENKKELRAHILSLEAANREIKKAQDETIKSEKLVSVGRLATGVAHEIGNPIGIILGYLELIKRQDLSPEEEQDFLGRIESEITRINHIIRQLLDFSRPAKDRKKETHTHEIIRGTVSMMEPQPMMAEIQVNLSLDAPRDVVFADPNQLQQVFLNIILNAADAMGEQRLSGMNTSAGVLRIETQNEDDSIAVHFTDSGPGIAEKALAHIFDPFYTTKDPGKGTGLGLSVSYRIIEDLGGTIRAMSEPEKGATFVIRIPLHASLPSQ
jgi:signal transduction histidine kinase